MTSDKEANLLRHPVFDLIKSAFVLRVICPHQSIPNVEIQAVIVIHLGVVHVVVRWGVEPLPKRVIHKTLGRNLIAQMPQYIEQQRPGGKQKQYQRVKRHHQYNHRNHADFQDSLKRMKRQGSQRRWVPGQVVYPVQHGKQTGVVHHAVHPVKIGVVQKHQEPKGKEQIAPAVFAHIEVDVGVAIAAQPINAQSNGSPYKSRGNGMRQFIEDVLGFGFNLLDLFDEKTLLEQHVEDQKGAACKNQVPHKNG